MVSSGSGNGHRRPTVPPGLGALAPDRGALEGRPPTFPVDVAAAERAVSDLLVALGADPSSEHLGDTPRRVADAYAEFLTPEPFDLASFPNDEGYDELVVARAIPVRSLCQHHLLPFTGIAHVGYCPASGSLVCPSSPVWSSCSPVACRSRNA